MEDWLAAYIAGRGGVAQGEPFVEDGVSRVRVKCVNNHIWAPRVDNFKFSSSWCPECYGNQPHDIGVMRALAEARGGACLSNNYVNISTHLDWRCSLGHTWQATPNNVKNHKSWCPHCCVNIGEELVRATLMEAFPGQEFERTRRVPWMGGLELDGYNEKLAIAFEYQGIQHTERVPHFQREEKDFERQQANDALTLARCEENHVKLLVILHTVHYKGLRQHVRETLTRLGYEVAPIVFSEREFYDNVLARSPSRTRQYKRLLEVVARKGGKCLSERFVGREVPVEIECQQGHRFMASLADIDQPESRGPRFCTDCGGTRRKTDDELREKANARGFEYVRVESRRCGRRMRRYIIVICPELHLCDILLDNFTAKRRQKALGCKDCSDAQKGRNKRADLSGWTKKTGVRLTGEYGGREAQHQWTCAQEHTIQCNFRELSARGDEPCLYCKWLKFARDNDLELVSAWKDGWPAAAPLKWKHIRCGDPFDMSLMCAGRKNAFCENPECLGE